MPDLTGKRVAILVTDGFEQIELFDPRNALDAAGARTEVLAPKPAKGKDAGKDPATVKGWNHTDWGQEVPVDRPLDGADPAAYDALLLPGGVMNPDKLRRNEAVQRFVRHFFDEGKPVAAICHGPWTLIDAGVARGRKMTSYHSIQEDLKNAGAEWSDQEVVVDGNLVTSRKPDDLPAFDREMVRVFAAAERMAGAGKS
jgi:protease I